MITPRIEYTESLNQISGYLEAVDRDISKMLIAISVMDTDMRDTAGTINDITQAILRQIDQFKQLPVEERNLDAFRQSCNREIDLARDESLANFRSLMGARDYVVEGEQFTKITPEKRQELEQAFLENWNQKVLSLQTPPENIEGLEDYFHYVEMQTHTSMEQYVALLDDKTELNQKKCDVEEAVGRRYKELKDLKANLQEQMRAGLKSMNIFLAAQLGDVDFIKSKAPLFIGTKKFFNQTDERGYSMLHIAACTSQPAVVGYLLQQGADPSLQDSVGDQALHWAAGAGAYQVSCMLIAAKADVNAQGHHKRTPLYKAVQRGFCNLANMLIGKGADINTRMQGHTPLFEAVNRNNLDMVRLLCGYRTLDVSIRDHQNHTVFFYANQMLEKNVLTEGILESLFHHHTSPYHDLSALKHKAADSL